MMCLSIKHVIYLLVKTMFPAPSKAAAGGFHVEMMGLIGAGNNPMVGMTVAVAVAIEEAMK